MNVLITGIAGLMGSRLASYILDNCKGVKVVGIDDLSGGYIENVDKRCIFYNIDLAKDVKKIDNIFEKEKFTRRLYFTSGKLINLSAVLIYISIVTHIN